MIEKKGISEKMNSKAERKVYSVKGKNPLRLSFMSMAVICCLVLSSVFLYIRHTNNQATQRQWAQDKVQLAMSDLESQLSLMEDISVLIASNYEFHPFYFKENIARELSMLKAFKQYRFYTSLTEEYFLYFGGNRLYRSTGNTLNLNVFLNSRMEDAQDKECFRNALSDMQDESTQIWREMKMLAIQEEIYVLFPLKVNAGEQSIKAVMGFIVKENSLESRFQVVSGQMQGRLSLYWGEELLYTNQEQPCTGQEKNAVTAVATDGSLKLCYLPEKVNSVSSSFFLLQILLVMVNIFLIFFVANLFANKAHMPIWRLLDKYSDRISEQNGEYKDDFAELESMMNSMVQNNLAARQQIQYRNKLLRKQILRLLLEGKASEEVLSCLEKMEILIPGPFFFVVSISFEEGEIDENFLEKIQGELDQICNNATGEYVYAISNQQESLINAICSIEIKGYRDELVEMISEVAGGFGYKPSIGIGNIYDSLENLPSSWLESIDELYCLRTRQNHIHYADRIQRLYDMLEGGSEQEAKKELESFGEWLKEMSPSMLLQQAMLTDLLAGLGRLGRKHMIELSQKDISLMIASAGGQNFPSVTLGVLHSFYEKYEESRKQAREDEDLKIFTYINEHFAEPDMSLEKVAEEMHVSTTVVHRAVVANSGKMYKDYLIHLRIAYAKELLGQEDLQVSEVCERVGYISISYFISIFREITGVTPAKYKKNIKNKT